MKDIVRDYWALVLHITGRICVAQTSASKGISFALLSVHQLLIRYAAVVLLPSRSGSIPSWKSEFAVKHFCFVDEISVPIGYVKRVASIVGENTITNGVISKAKLETGKNEMNAIFRPPIFPPEDAPWQLFNFKKKNYRKQKKTAHNGQLDNSRLVWSHFRPKCGTGPHRYTLCRETPRFLCRSTLARCSLPHLNFHPLSQTDSFLSSTIGLGLFYSFKKRQ